MQGSVTVIMQAPPAKVWALVSDVTRIGEFSPETFEAEWLGGATGPAVGVRFRGHVKRNGRGPTYWSTCRIAACDPEHEFRFDVVAGNKVLNTWGYRLEPAGTGTAVTEFFELQPTLPTKIYWAIAGAARGRTNERGMQTTLDRIKAVVEA